MDSLLAQQAALHSRLEHTSWQTAPELDMKLPLYQLELDELRLINKLDTPRRALPSHSTAGSHSLGQWASAPHARPVRVHSGHCQCLQRVPRGEDQSEGKRQHRMFGIDRHKVYNKHVNTAGHRRRISFEVTRAYRAIRSIASITAQSTQFTVVYHEKGGKLSSREYETETRIDCAEIVAKIRFLMQLAQQEQQHAQAVEGTGGGAGAGSGGAGGVLLHLPTAVGSNAAVHSPLSAQNS